MQASSDAAITKSLNNKLRKEMLTSSKGMAKSLNNYLNFSALYLNYLHAKYMNERKIDIRLIERYMKRRGIWEQVVKVDGKIKQI